MRKELTQLPPSLTVIVQELNLFPGLRQQLLFLSQDGFRGATVSQLLGAISQPDAVFVAEHPHLGPLLDRKEVLSALQPLVVSFPHLLVTKLVKSLDEDDSKQRQFVDKLTRLTLLSKSEIQVIARACSPDERVQVIRAITLLKQGHEEGLQLLLRSNSVSAFHQNQLLLNIPRIGTELLEKVLQIVGQSAMDGRDFDGDIRRMKKYGVDPDDPAAASYPLWAASDANRNVSQALVRDLSHGHLAKLAGIDVKEFSSSQDSRLMNIKRQALLMQPGAAFLVQGSIENTVVRGQEVFPDSMLLHSLALLSPGKVEVSASKTESLELYIRDLYSNPDIEYVDVQLRNRKGQFVATRRISHRDNARVIFPTTTFSQEQTLTFTATAQTFSGKKLRYEPVIIQ
jgi:hypothetical protein